MTSLHHQIVILRMVKDILVFQVLVEIIIIREIGMLIFQKPPTDILSEKLQTYMPIKWIIIITHIMMKTFKS